MTPPSDVCGAQEWQPGRDKPVAPPIDARTASIPRLDEEIKAGVMTKVSFLPTEDGLHPAMASYLVAMASHLVLFHAWGLSHHI